MSNCHYCQHPLSATAKFCENCSKPIHEESIKTANMPVGGPNGLVGWLAPTSGAWRSQSLKLQIDGPDGKITVGRDDTCEITIEDDSVSREHLRFMLDDGRLFVIDLDSANGTKLDGEALKAYERAALHDECRIEVGEVSLLFKQF